MQYSNQISEIYIRNRNRIKDVFPEAVTFLKQLENLPDKGFHIGTQLDLDLYYKQSLILHITLHLDSLELSTSMGGLKEDTKDGSKRFFKFFQSRLERFANDGSKTIEIFPWHVGRLFVNRTKQSNLFFKTFLETLFEFSVSDIALNAAETTSDTNPADEEIATKAGDTATVSNVKSKGKGRSGSLSGKNAIKVVDPMLPDSIESRNKDNSPQPSSKKDSSPTGNNVSPFASMKLNDFEILIDAGPLAEGFSYYRLGVLEEVQKTAPGNWSTSVRGPNHQVKVIVDKGTVVNATCSCTEKTDYCSHIVATLYTIHYGLFDAKNSKIKVPLKPGKAKDAKKNKS